MEMREFHDALVVGVDPTGTDLRLRLERVSVYEEDRLVRQEGGVLHFEGLHDCRVDDEAATPRLELEYGRVLDWALENGAGRFLIEWVGHAPASEQMSDLTFRFQAFAWHPQFEHSD